MKQKQKNVRPLDTIADNIHKLERGNIFDIGDLLLEAKAQCEHGKWLDWLYHEFDWVSAATAERYMKIAKLGAKFCNLQNLKLAKTTLYQLADECEDDDLPAIVSELAKRATKTRLAPRDAKRVIKIGIGRRRFGNHPDATLVQLVELDEFSDETWHEKAVAALREREPVTDEKASLIVDEIEAAERMRSRRPSAKYYAEQEAESILDGTPPDLPPPITPPEPQKLDADTDWAEAEAFANLVSGLCDLRAKPVARLAGMVSPAKLREAIDLLMAVAAADKAQATTPVPPDGSMPDVPPFLDRRQQHADEAKAEAEG